HSAREDVATDEIHLALVARVEAILDSDGLDRGDAARLQPVADLAEVSRPVFLADRLDHLDRGDAIIQAPLVAIVLELDLDLAVETCGGDALPPELVLLAADGQPDHADVVTLRDVFGKAAPATADLEHALARREPQPLGKRFVFACLRCGEVVA